MEFIDIWVDLSSAEGSCLYTKKIMDRWDNARLTNEELGKIVNDMFDQAIANNESGDVSGVGFQAASAIVRGDIANAS